MRPGNIPQGNKSKPRSVVSLVDSGKSNTSGMRIGNTKKEGQMDKPFKG
jgi:hypothetical protein